MEPTRKSKSRRFGLKAAVAVSLTLCACIPFMSTSDDAVRTVRAKVVVDPDFAAHSLWHRNVMNLMGNASRVFKSWCEVQFDVDTTLVWDIEKTDSYGKMFTNDCLVKEVSRDGADIVVYFSKETKPVSTASGLSHYEEGYVHVRQTESFHDEKGYPAAFHALVHELGHLFGAVHLYPEHNVFFFMDPWARDELFSERGIGTQYLEPTFHDGNAKVMLGLKHRGFSEQAWSDVLWPDILAGYARLRELYNPWKVAVDGTLRSTALNRYVEWEPYQYLASWASLAGIDSVAHACLDSLEWLYGAIRTTCVRDPGGPTAQRICDKCGTSEWSTTRWVQCRRSELCWRRAVVYLRSGNVAQADSCLDSLLLLWPQMSGELKEKYRNTYAFYRELLGPKDDTAEAEPAGTPPAPAPAVESTPEDTADTSAASADTTATDTTGTEPATPAEEAAPADSTPTDTTAAPVGSGSKDSAASAEPEPADTASPAPIEESPEDGTKGKTDEADSSLGHAPPPAPDSLHFAFYTWGVPTHYFTDGDTITRWCRRMIVGRFRQEFCSFFERDAQEYVHLQRAERNYLVGTLGFRLPGAVSLLAFAQDLSSQPRWKLSGWGVGSLVACLCALAADTVFAIVGNVEFKRALRSRSERLAREQATGATTRTGEGTS